MAKFKHNNFLETIDGVISDAARQGVVHLYAEDESFDTGKIKIKGSVLSHFGTTGYLGLGQDPRLKKAAIEAITKYGTQFPLSKTYISHPLYRRLEEKVSEMYGNPVIITKNSTLGHLGAIPTAVRDEDSVILDHQVHWSVQNAVQLLKPRGVSVEMIRHNNLNMLEDRIKRLSGKSASIWYMADGVYSMYGDCAPVKELLTLCNRYPQLRLYFDDVHGMSWKGRNGTGYVLDQMKTLPEHTLLFGTLSKTFGASGAVLVCSDSRLHRVIKNFGGPLTFSAQLEPASVGAALASADIHLSQEIYSLQRELAEKIQYFNDLLANTDLPLVETNDCPVFYIGTGAPATGYNLVGRIMQEGFFVNLGLYPAVPVKNTGIRITISRHNSLDDIRRLTEALVYHYPKALEETGTTSGRVRRAFGLLSKEFGQHVTDQLLHIQYETSIRSLGKADWDMLMGKQSVFDWEGLLFLEDVFNGNERPEHNMSFHYFIIRDGEGKIILATFFSDTVWKDDLLAPASVSVKLEEMRKQDPYYLTSRVLSMGSPFTEGQHCFLDRSNSLWKNALSLLLGQLELLAQKSNASMIVMRDFTDDNDLNMFFHGQGFIRFGMPDSCVIDPVRWQGVGEYVKSLSARSRKHFRTDIAAYEDHFDVVVADTISEEEVIVFSRLYENVRRRNFDLNTFSFPDKLFRKMSRDHNWEFIVLYLRKKDDDCTERPPVGVMFCYKNNAHTYVPAFIGMDYNVIREHQTYRQLLFQTIKRAIELGFKRIDFGMTAAFEKRKVGAAIVPKFAYVQAKDNFSMELIQMMQGASWDPSAKK